MLRMPEDSAHWQSFWAGAVGIILYSIVLVLWRSKSPVFVDVICVDQVNPQRKGQGMLSIGGFLKHSSSMLILFDATFCHRLWCVFEIAAFVKSRPKGQRPKFIIRPTTLGPCYLLFTMTVWALTIVGDIVPDSDQELMWALQALAVFIGFSGSTFVLRRFFHSVDACRDMLGVFTVRDASCCCCSSNHADNHGLCDRKIMIECITAWFGSVENFEDAVRSDLAGVVLEQSQQAISYGQVVLALVPLVWNYLDRASAYARFTSWDPRTQALRELIRGLGWWLGLGPLAALTQFWLTYKLRWRCSTWWCDALLNLPPLLGMGVVIAGLQQFEHWCFVLVAFEHDAKVPAMLVFSTATITAALALFRCARHARIHS